MANKSPFDRHPIKLFMEKSRNAKTKKYRETAKIVNAMTMFPRGGKNCRNRSRLNGVSEIACAKRDRDPAVIKRTLMSDNEDIHHEDSTKNVIFAQYYCKTRPYSVCFFTTLQVFI